MRKSIIEHHIWNFKGAQMWHEDAISKTLELEHDLNKHDSSRYLLYQINIVKRDFSPFSLCFGKGKIYLVKPLKGFALPLPFINKKLVGHFEITHCDTRDCPVINMEASA
jgi:hypothetical protein